MNKDKDQTWHCWCGVCSKVGILDPFLLSLSEHKQELLLCAFLCTYRTAQWNQSGQLLATDKKALAGLTLRAATSNLAVLFWDSRLQPSPLHSKDSSQLFPSITALLKAIDLVDDPPNCQQAITPWFL
jgi:hypothetical protein